MKRPTILEPVVEAVSERLARYGMSQTGTIEREIALAAIKGMREATAEMVDAGRDVGPAVPYGVHEVCERWTVMVDAAIAEAEAALEEHRAMIAAKP